MKKFLIQYDKQNPIQDDIFKILTQYPIYLNIYPQETIDNLKSQDNVIEKEIEKQFNEAVLIKKGKSFHYQEDTFTEKPNFNLIIKKNELISKRKSILNQNKDIFIKMFRDFLLTISTSQNPAESIMIIANQNKIFCENDKKIENEIVEIKNTTSLEDLEKFE